MQVWHFMFCLLDVLARIVQIFVRPRSVLLLSTVKAVDKSRHAFSAALLQESQNAPQKDHCIWGCMVTVRPQNCGSCRAQCDTRPYPAFPSLTTFECLFQRNLLLSLRQKEKLSYKTYMLYGVQSKIVRMLLVVLPIHTVE